MDYKILAKTVGMEHEDWLELRNKGIGGSDVGAIAGLNKWKSAYSVYLDKIGAGQEVQDNESMYFGRELEDFVAKEFTKRTGLKVKKFNAVLQSVYHPFMTANLDRVIVGQKWGLECKTVSEYGKDEWLGEDIPESYLLQCQHYMAVTGFEKFYISALVGGNKFVIKEIPRDEELIDYLIEIEKDFWENHVMVEVPPSVDGSDSTTAGLINLFPKSDEGSEIALPYETIELIEYRNSLKQQIKELTSKCDEYENKLKSMLETNENGFVDKYKVVWKSYETNRLDTKRLREELPDIYEKFINKSNMRKFEIKELKSKGDLQ